MRIRIKLVFMMLVFTLVPCLVLAVVFFDFFMKQQTEYNIDYINRAISNESINIGYYFNNVLSYSKGIANLPQIKEYVTLTNEEENDNNISSLEEKANNTIRDVQKSGADLLSSRIINNSKIIVASTNENEVGKKITDADNIEFTESGISLLKQKEINNNNVIYFSVSTDIYSIDNECQGVLYQEYTISFIQNSISSTGFGKYTNVIIIDDAGKSLISPYSYLSDFRKSSYVSPVAEYISKILENSEKPDNQNEFANYYCTENNKLISCYKIQNTKFYLVGYSEIVKCKDEFDDGTVYLKLFVAFICFALVVCELIYSAKYLKPVETIIHTLNKKQKGDINATFSVESRDEFGNISRALNDLFNNVTANEQRYRTIVEMTNNIIFEINLKNDTVFVSKNFNKQFSLRPKNDTLEESFFRKARVHKDDKERFIHDLDKMLQTSNFMQGEYRIKSIYGDFNWYEIKANKFYDTNEFPSKIIGIIADIDKEKKSEMHLVHKASYDNLTQLFNREAFKKNLDAEIERSKEKKTLDALLFIDLDDFKYFNDQYGHACGDEVLKFVADTLKEITFEKGFAGRIGGDEFVVCLKNLTLIGDAGKIAQEIIDVLAEGFNSEINGLDLNIHCSIGIAFFRENGSTSEDLIASADDAMYVIKKHGKSAYTYAKSATKMNHSK